jgi:hypothetical protein
MSLEALYNQAASNTYVGIARNRQAADAPTNQTLVNFLDGQSRGTQQTADQLQRGFIRNAAGSYVSSGGQGVSRNPTQNLTRWTDKAFKIAFDGEGPTQLERGFYTNQFRTAVGPRGPVTVHNYSPLTGRKFRDLNSAARRKIDASPSGAPTGF